MNIKSLVGRHNPGDDSGSSPAVDVVGCSSAVFDSDDLDYVTAAYHEAGHALMAHLLGGEVTRVSIEEEDEDEGGDIAWQGLTSVRWPACGDTQQRRRSALVALAGPVAETRWRGGTDTLTALTAWRADWREVQRALSREAHNVDPTHLLEQWLREVRSHFADLRTWESLCRVADALEAHGSLDCDLLDDVLGRH